MQVNKDDFRVESLIAFWLENETIDMHHVLVEPKGIFERQYRSDILEVEPSNSLPDAFAFNTSREGLYDMLPEGLFHEAERKTRKTTGESVDESKRYKEEEKAARKFFLPLEQEFYRQKIWIEHAELRTCLSSVRSDHVNLFLEFWGVDKELFNDDQSAFMLALLPNLHRVVGNTELVTSCLEVLLQEAVKIDLVESKGQVLNDGLASFLGDFVLGVDAVLGTGFQDDEPAIEINIGPVYPEKLIDYLPEGKTDRLLKTLYGFFFPAENEVYTSFIVEENSAFFALQEEAHASRLGFTTVIGPY